MRFGIDAFSTRRLCCVGWPFLYVDVIQSTAFLPGSRLPENVERKETQKKRESRRGRWPALLSRGRLPPDLRHYFKLETDTSARIFSTFILYFCFVFIFSFHHSAQFRRLISIDCYGRKVRKTSFLLLDSAGISVQQQTPTKAAAAAAPLL